MDIERPDRRRQPIAAAQSGLTVYVTGLLPEAPGRNIDLYEGPILVLRAAHSARGSVPWIWNDQTGATNRLPQRRVD